jgi:hypothetical protein
MIGEQDEDWVNWIPEAQKLDPGAVDPELIR